MPNSADINPSTHSLRKVARGYNSDFLAICQASAVTSTAKAVFQLRQVVRSFDSEIYQNCVKRVCLF